MDRDIVNALHYLYQNGATEWQFLAGRLWCGADSGPTVNAFVNNDGPRLKLTDELMIFLKAVEGQLANMPKPDFFFSFPLAEAIRNPRAPRPCFVAIAYGTGWFNDVQQAIVKSAASAGFEAEVSKDLKTPGSITDQIWQGIRRADVVVVDVTDHNPNVFYELGLAHALGKEVIVLAQDVTKVPFDIKTSRLLEYDQTKLADLEADLAKAFHSVTARYKYEGREPRF